MSISNDALRAKREIQSLTGATTITEADSGKILLLNAAAGAAISLPAAAEGLVFKFIVKQEFATSDWVITPADADSISGTLVVDGASVAVDAADTVTFELGADQVGDFVEFISDGDGWFVSGVGQAASSITAAG